MVIRIAEQFLADPRALHEETDVELVGHAHAAVHLHSFLNRERRGRTGAGLCHGDGRAGIFEVAIERTVMVDAHNAARIEFANVEVDADHVLGEVDQGAALLDGVLNIGRGAVASEMVGLSEEVFGRTVTYLKERKQFGKLIGEFQALQHRAAQLYIDIEITRAAVLKALQALDGNFESAGAAIAVAKARAGTTATLAVQEGVQMHGGMGMTDQFDIGFFMKRARVCQELFGDSNYHADQLARAKSY